MRSLSGVVIGLLAATASVAAGTKSKCDKACRAPSAAEVKRVNKWIADLAKLRAAPADTYVLDSDDPPRDHKVTAAQLKDYVFKAHDRAKHEIALADQLAAPYDSLEHYNLDEPLASGLPTFAKKLAGHSGVRLLIAHYTSGFDGDRKLLRDAPAHAKDDSDSGTGTAMAIDEGAMGRKEGEYKMSKTGGTVTTDLWLAYDAKGNLIALGASHMVLE